VTGEGIDSALDRAARLFNDGAYHEAHEVLDELWENSTQRDADFFKGLIQACIALHHYQRGNPEGARKLYSGHRQYLAAYGPSYRGLDVTRFLGEMQASLSGVLRARVGQELPFDPARRPRLELGEKR